MVGIVRATLLSTLACLAGCAGPSYFLAPNAGTPPKVLVAHLQPVQVKNQDDLKEDLGFDETRLREWMKPLLAEQLAGRLGYDSIVWNDDLATTTDTVVLGKRTFVLPRPSDTTGTGWVLVVSYPWFYRSVQPGYYVNGVYSGGHSSLDLSVYYRLRDLSSRSDLAYGWAYGTSSFSIYMDQTDWRKATSNLGAELRGRLPKKPGAK